MKALNNILLLISFLAAVSCSKSFDTSGFLVGVNGTEENQFISSFDKDDFSFKVKYKNEEEYYQKNDLDSVRIFIFSMSYKGKDPLEYLAGNKTEYSQALERNSFNKDRVFGALTTEGDTVYPLISSAPRTYGMDGQFTTLLSFHNSIEHQNPIRLFYRDKSITNKPILFQFNP